MSLMRRAASAILRGVVRAAPAESRRWATAMLNELDQVEGDLAALRWALGGATALLRLSRRSTLVTSAALAVVVLLLAAGTGSSESRPANLGPVAYSGQDPEVNGVWSGQAVDRGNSVALVLNLAHSGNTLTGTISTPPDDGPFTIANGQIHGAKLSFDVSVTHPDAGATRFAVTATVAGNQMRGAITNTREGVTLPFTLTRGAPSPASARPAGGAGGRHTTRAPAGAEPPNPKGADPVPVDARKAVLAASADHEVVALGILSYANQDFDSFILALIRDPAFPETVRDIVVECGNSLYQPVLDRYIAGQDVRLAEARDTWRNTTQPMCGLSAFYEQLFPLVRQINLALPADKRLRVLAGDPPIDWSKVRNREEMTAFGNRDASIASVMEREVLARRRKALMIFGVRHLMHGGGGAVGTYERKVEAGGGPHLTFVIMAHNGFGNRSPLTRHNDALERRLASWPVPSLVPLPGTWLADLDYGYFFPGEGGGSRRIAAGVDAYLYLGPRALLLNEPISADAAADAAYMKELARRATIGGHLVTPDDILRNALDSSVFFNEHAGQVNEAER